MTPARTSSDPADEPTARPRPLPYQRRTEADLAAMGIGVDPAEPEGTKRRQFLGYLLAAPTLAVAAQVGADLYRPQKAEAVVPSLPSPSDLFDLGDLQDLAAMPTSNLIKVVINTDGTASFDMPRAEVGQGITTTLGMLIAEELDLPLDKVVVTLADARPELLFNQLTGGSNTVRSMYHPTRVAAAGARARLVAAAAAQWGVDASTLTTAAGVVKAPDGRTATYGSLATAAASASVSTFSVQLKDPSEFRLVGTPQGRVDAFEAVTGRKKFAMDLVDVCPEAMPTMVARPPTINGKPVSVGNLDAVRTMPGITDVAIVSSGVAVRGRTFGHCIDAVDALQVQWGPGTEDGKSDADIERELKNAEIPLAVPKLDLLTKSVEGRFTFRFRSNSPLETNCAIADVKDDSVEVWSSLKVPIVAQERIAVKMGLPVSKVKVHVVTGGGSFGRHLFSDAALEAVEISKAMGKPVKLMWHRTDDFRHGRTHPMATTRIRATYGLGNVLTFEQRHTSISTDFTHGLGEILTAYSAMLPGGNYSFAQSIFELTANCSYNFGVVTQLLDEVDMGFHTGSTRNIYSPDVCTGIELMVDQLAKGMGKDPYKFRREFLKNARQRAVLDKAAEVGQWGKAMPAGTAQGIAFHEEYKGVAACVVELDCRPETVNRKIRDAVTGPRVTKVTYVVDVGLPLNPKGLEAQMIGGVMDGIAQTLTNSLHLKDGIFLEGSWDNYFYTRQWNTPFETNIVIMPPTTGKPGGAGEFGVAASAAAVACAYARATGTVPTEFPINHQTLSFEPLPTVPPIPEEPTDNLDYVH